MKKIYSNSIAFFLFFVLLFAGRMYAQTEIVYVYDPARLNTVTGINPDEEATVAILQDAGYVVTLFPVVALSTATPEQLDMLNNAPLVYIGRAVASTNFQDPNKAFWNEITAPIMTGNMWALRNSRMNWFPTADCESNNGYGIEDIVQAEILEMDDPVFHGISESIIDWWIGPYNTIATADAGNGTVLAVETMGMRPVFVRWDADSEFYPGSADMPFGPRTFFGLDGDGATDAEGNTLWQYSKYTELGMQVFLNEVAFLTGTLEDKTSAREMNLNARIGWNPANGQLSVEMNQLAKVDVLDLMGRTIYTSSVRQDRADINLSHAGKGLFVVRIINNNQQSYTRKIRMQ